MAFIYIRTPFGNSPSIVGFHLNTKDSFVLSFFKNSTRDIYATESDLENKNVFVFSYFLITYE
jgi:hypothetical protein